MVYKTAVIGKAKHLKVLKTMVFSETTVFLEYLKKTLFPNTPLSCSLWESEASLLNFVH